LHQLQDNSPYAASIRPTDFSGSYVCQAVPALDHKTFAVEYLDSAVREYLSLQEIFICSNPLSSQTLL